jgi:hypothetical protein
MWMLTQVQRHSARRGGAISAICVSCVRLTTPDGAQPSLVFWGQNAYN